MSLSEQEQQLLREIEESLLADDPKFGATVSSTRVTDSDSGSGRLTMRSLAIIMLGLLLLVAGVALAANSLWFVVISIIGFMVMFAGGVWALKTPSNTAGRSNVTHIGQAPSSSSRGSRMEENFRRRFEQP